MQYGVVPPPWRISRHGVTHVLYAYYCLSELAVGYIQESCATVKVIARCALHISALTILGVP